MYICQENTYCAESNSNEIFLQFVATLLLVQYHVCTVTDILKLISREDITYLIEAENYSTLRLAILSQLLLLDMQRSAFV